MQRKSSLDRLRAGAETFDILVVGGGASGLGAAVDAAARGYRVALIEQADFAKGTSSRSTKLVHGGVRYMAQGNISLVMSALRERGRLQRNAPHLVHPMPFVIPNYSWWGGPYYAFGMTLYDRLAGRWSFGRSQRLTRAETVRHLPTVEQQGLAGGVLYYDGQFDDARLAINLAQTAVERGAVLANYCACVGLQKENDLVTGVMARDTESGAEFTIRARVVINATGIWTTETERLAGIKDPLMVRPSKGIHLVVPRDRIESDCALILPTEKSVLFVLPGDRIPPAETLTVPLMVPLPPRTAPLATVTALPAANEPFTSSAPPFTAVVPV